MFIYVNTLVYTLVFLGITTFLTIQHILFLFPADVESNLEILFFTDTSQGGKTKF